MDPAAIQNAVEHFADFLLKYFIALAAVGAFAMAVIEAWKKLFDSRTRYHMQAVQRWIGIEGGRDFAAGALLRSAVTPPSPERAYAELIHLTTGTEPPRDDAAAQRLFAYGEAASRKLRIPRSAELALFSLELERMMGHIQDAGDSALKDPKRYPNLYRFLVWGAKASDIKDWSTQATAISPMGSRRGPRGKDGAFAVSLNEKPDRKKAADRANLYARLHDATKRKLDGFQLYTAYRWTNLNQLAANIIGAATLFGALLWAQFVSGKTMSCWTLLLFFVISLAGGALAPVAKDIVTALQKVKGRG
ncbi:MAG: hypothetical protein A2150_03440 [Candidatus Muproteobacteria bacterium RBG_16_64_11]|uniref:Uncharacterized protein n=1 Tax=Candidatus Muproteobacteria bacterium RBG_16_64_11 TaxID=1817758 RepID=A0A1F6TBU9_9PROT|nr:MAG: hypothetical protein A2150_03440 [Candidatus Muproteobacteria bacterium RBG_16_64_11]